MLLSYRTILNTYLRRTNEYHLLCAVFRLVNPTHKQLTIHRKGSTQINPTLTLHNLKRWSNTSKLCFSSSKFKCVFCMRKHTAQSIHLQMNGFSLFILDVAEFLSLMYDKKLTWKAHVLGLKEKCLFALNILKNSIINMIGPPSKKLLNVYKILVRPKLDYGSIVCSSIFDLLFRTLGPVPNMYLQLVLRAFSTTPTPSCMLSLVYVRSNTDAKSSVITNLYTRYQNSCLHLP